MVYTTKEISEKTGVSIHTLRYYEQIGLLDPVERAANGHRRYTDADVRRLDFLKRLKGTGMSINEMVHYVTLFREGEATVTERRIILEEHRAQVEAQVAMLQETLRLLDSKIEHYQQLEAAV